MSYCIMSVTCSFEVCAGAWHVDKYLLETSAWKRNLDQGSVTQLSDTAENSFQGLPRSKEE